jgi:DNA segregation ATPase FtsK/SpoIIIE, S-DNA-T family
MESARTQYQRRMASDTQTYQNAVAQLHGTINDYTAKADSTAAPWSASAWQSWTPPTDFQPQNRMGTLQTGITQHAFAWPGFMSFPDTSPLLVKATGASREISVQGIQSLLTRLLATIPPGKLRLTFLDPVGLGQNAAPFMQLADHDEELVTSRAWSESPHIEQRLVDLTEHISNVIQKYLRNQYETIEEYNEAAGEIAEPYRVLVVFDFPTNFSDAAAHRLVSIAQNGPRCGVYTIVLADTDKPMPHGFMLDTLAQVSEVITAKDGHFVWEDDDFRDCRLTLDTPPEGTLFDRIVNTVGEAAKMASRVEVPFRRIAPVRQEWWQETSEAKLHVPLGPTGARKIQELALGQGTGIHALVAGKTGSGKSTLLHTIITGSALIYGPDELELYLIDFKQGVEFKTYATNALPHARVIAIESEREFGLSVLQGLDAELKRRGDLLRAAGVDGLADYRKKFTERMPRILLLVDEFQEFFTEDDPIASQSGLILDRLVRQGRAYGIHVLLGSQTLAGAYSLARSTIDQMAVRIALQCSEADSRLILSDDNPAARLLSRPGEAIYNAANGMIEGNNRFQVAWLPDDERDEYLKQIRAMADQQQYNPPQPQIIFEGNKPAEIEKNRPLDDLLRAEEQPAPSRATLAWLGEPIAIRDPVAASFRPQSGSNLLILGQDDEAALGMIATALVSLAAQLPVLRRATPQVAMLDFGAADGPYADLLETLMQGLPQTVAYGRRRHLPDMIGTFATEVQRRLDNDDQGGPELYLVLYGLHRARDLRQEEGGGFNFSPYSEEPPAPNPAQQFATILREGPDVGVHTIVWCDTMTNLNRTLDRRTLREFAMRIAFQMSAEDSANLVDSSAANKLGHHRALFYDEDAGRMEKFRPYAVPATDWLASASRQLATKGDLSAV